MTALVYLWPRQQGNVGHVSLLIGTTYVSYWPGSPAGKGDFKLGTTHAAAFPREYRTDVRLEKGEASERLYLTSLNESAMLSAWTDLVTRGSRYNMVKHNCSTVVAALLTVGSGITPLFAPSIKVSSIGLPFHLQFLLQIKYLGDTIRMWSPDAVAVYAKQIQQHQGGRK